jgi:ketosteroid isomerase-like protein
MSQQNVEIVRKLMTDFQHRDHERAFEYYDPEIEWDARGVADSIPDLARVYHGHEGVRAYWRSWLSAWKDLQFELEDVLDGGDEIVALIRNQRQWGRHSGIVTEFPPYALVFTFRDGKVIRWRTYADRADGLRAAGLEEAR